MEEEDDPRDIELMSEMMEKMTAPQLAETLEALARREAAVLRDPRVAGVPEMKEISMWNIAALCAAADRISRDQTGPRGTGTSPDGPGSAETPG